MARLRFPGRPGCRADRAGIPFCADDVTDSTDPALQFVVNLYKGLQEFRELRGESEDEVFEGFTEEDVRQSGKKLRGAIRSEHKLQGIQSAQRRVSQAEKPLPSVSNKKSSRRHSVSSSQQKSQGMSGIFGAGSGQGGDPALSREEILQKALAAKQLLASIKAKHKHALQGRIIHNRVGRPRKADQLVEKDAADVQPKPQTAAEETATEVKRKLVSKRAVRKNVCYQTPKVRLARRASASQVGEKSKLKEEEEQLVKEKENPGPQTEHKQVRPLPKDRSKSVVKQLLQKAKQGGSRQLAKVRGAGRGSKDTCPQKRVSHTFILPQFSRSRRAIIPNKRFIEDDPIPSALLIKRPRTESSCPPISKSVDTECKTEDETVPDNSDPQSKKEENYKSPATAPCPVKARKKALKLKAAALNSSTPASPNTNTRSQKSASDSALNSKVTMPVVASRKKSPKMKSVSSCALQSSRSRTGKSLSEERCTPTGKISNQVNEVDSQETVPSVEQQLQLEMSPVVAVTHHKMDSADAENNSSDLLITAPLSSSRKGLLEQPLIVEGKRQRVPSLKVRLTKRQSEESNSAFASDCEGAETSFQFEDLKQTGTKKEKFTLFPKAPASAPKTFNRAGPMKLQRRDKDGKESFLTKRSGQIMLRKAKLQLNRTALNRSKAALARSLKAQLKREAKQKGSKSEPQRHSPRPGVTSPLSISVLGSGGSHPFDSPNSQPSPLMAGLSPGSQGGFASPPKIVSSLSPISLPSKKEPGEATSDKSRELSANKESGGPRIKHVCRRAAVVLPKPLATFPAPPDPSESPTLSALPSPEKERLLQSHSANRDEEKDSSDEEKGKPGRKRKVIARERFKKQARFGRMGKRRGRCKECKGCLAPNCGKCVYCLDSKKFGGKNILKKACVNRTCERPRYSKQATDAFIQPKGRGGEGDEVDSSQVRQGPSRMARPAAGFFASLGDARGEGTQDEGEVEGAEHEGSPPRNHPRERAVRAPARVEAGDRGVMDEGGLEIMSAVGVQRHNLTHHARRLLKRKEKSGLRVRLPTVVPEPQPLVATSALWSVPPNTCSIVHPELKDSFFLEVAWSRGLALTFAGPTCVRSVCFLCGSAGREKLLYCSVCCEPFHWFCLDVEDRPLEGCNLDNWCCRRCQFCHVCGLQTGLLQCDRCQDTYHPECLGPAYPKQPSRRNVWVCTKCVRCKSCGATTPGSGNNATWTYDFSLCFDCGKLMDKGNFCPICRKCYADDDWESKMVQCGLCDSWVHARCEGLTDEMYQFFSFLPEDIQYRCRVCSPSDPPEWRTILHEELLSGLRSVLAGLTSFKCSHHLLVIDEAKEKERAQRALQRKKNIPAICNNEAVRSSPRVSRQPRGSQSSTPEKPASESVTAIGTSPSQSATHDTAEFNEHKPNLDSSPSVLTSSREEGREDVMEVSDTEADSVERAQDRSRTLESCDNENSSSPVSHQKAATMSEVGIFERITQGGVSSESTEQPASAAETELETQSESQACSRDCGDSELSSKKDNGQWNTEAMTSQNSTQHNTLECKRDTCLPEAKSSEVSSLTLADDIIPEDDNSDTSSTITASSKSSPDVSRNLFDAILSVSKNEGEGGDEGSSSGCGGKTDDSKTDQTCDCDEKDVKVEVLQSHDKKSDKNSVEEKTTNSTANISETAAGPSSGNITTVTERTNNIGDSNRSSSGDDTSGNTDTSSQHNHDMDVKVGDNVDHTLGDQPAGALPGHDSSGDSGTADGGTNSSPESAGKNARQPVVVTINMVTDDSRAVVPRFQRQFPRDFSAVRMKLDADKYGSVEEFNEDVVHIIQTALSEDELFPTRRKHNNSVKSIFIKQMERVFPWFNVKTCQLWQHNRVLPQGMLPDAVVPPYTDHTYAQWLEREKMLSSPQLSTFKRMITASEDATTGDSQETCEDVRQCALCLEIGDDFPEDAGRLLYAGQDDWVHVNCALWSAEVFEEADGSLQNVHVAMVRGRQLRCNRCQAQGATVGCCIRGCPSNYHFLCARRQLCLFKEDKTMYCYLHREHANSQIETQKVFSVSRRLFVDMADVRCLKKSWIRGLDSAFVNVLFGSCTVESLGSLAPLSDCKGCLLPLEFSCSRVYWSTVDAQRRTVYTCRIFEDKPTPQTPELVLRDVRVVHDEQHPDFVPLESLDLPSMGLSHVLPHTEDVVFISQSSPQKSSNHEQEASPSLHHAESVADRFLGLTERSSQSNIPTSESAEGSVEKSSDSSSSCVASTQQSSAGGQPLPAVKYSGLSASTLKLLNITDPKQVPSLPSFVPAEDTQREFGNLTGMVQRLNNAAMRSRIKEKQSSGDGLRSKRCNSVDRSLPNTARPRGPLRRATSLSPVAFTRAASPFIFPPRVMSPPTLLQSPPLPEAQGSSALPVHKPLVVTPILEQLENELTESEPNSGEIAVTKMKKSGLPGHASKETVVDLILEEDESESSGVQDVKSQAEEKKDSVGLGKKGFEEMEDVAGDVALAEQVLSTVPKEILEGSEVKVLVIPDSVSEDEAIQLAEEALRQNSQQEDCANPSQEQASCDPSQDSIEDAGIRAKFTPGSKDKEKDSCSVGSSGSFTSTDVDDCQVVGQTTKKTDLPNEDCALPECAGDSCAEQLSGDCKKTRELCVIDGQPTVMAHAQQTGKDPEVSQISQTSAVSSSPMETSPNQSQVASSTLSQSTSLIPGTSQSKDTHVTSSLKMSVELKVAPVYDKKGNLIGQRKHRPYVVETVQNLGDSIHIQRDLGNFVGGAPKIPKEHFRLPLHKSPPMGQSLLAEDRESPQTKDLVMSQTCAETSTDVSGDSQDTRTVREGKMTEKLSCDEKDAAGDVEIVSGVADGEKAVVSAESSGPVPPVRTELSASEQPEQTAVQSHADTDPAVSASQQTAKQTAVQSSAGTDPAVSDSPAGDCDQDHTGINPSIKLPEDVDARRLQCSVSVHKLCLDDVNSSVSVKDMHQQHGSSKCVAGACSVKSPKKSVAPLLQTDTHTPQKDSTKLSADPESGDGENVTQSPSLTENTINKQNTPDDEVSDIIPANLKNLKCNVSSASTPSKLCEKLGLSRTPSTELECLDSIMSVGGKPLCNGLDKEQSLDKTTLCSKDAFVDIALHPPSSMDKSISEALRTVECRVSLERLSSSSSSQDVGVEATSQASCGSSHEGDTFSSQHGASGNSVKHLSARRRSSAQSADAAICSENGSELTCDDKLSEGSASGNSFPTSHSADTASASHHGNINNLTSSESPSPASSQEDRVKMETAVTSDSVNDTGHRDDEPRPVSDKESDGQSSVHNPPSDKTSSADSEGTKGEGDCLPLHTEIALRIKAESLARSSPGESGPFKCPTCKRLYRTADSFRAHAQSCDFDLSTSDEEEEGEDENREDEPADGGKEEEEDTKKGLRTSLRQSTLTQRKAMESSQQQLAQQAAGKTVSVSSSKSYKGCVGEEALHRGRGRPRKLPVSDAGDNHGAERLMDCVKRARGRPRRSSGQTDQENSGVEKPVEQLSPKESLLGAVGLVSKTCLETHTSSKAPLYVSSQQECGAQRLSACSSSVLLQCLSRKSLEAESQRKVTSAETSVSQTESTPPVSSALSSVQSTPNTNSLSSLKTVSSDVIQSKQHSESSAVHHTENVRTDHVSNKKAPHQDMGLNTGTSDITKQPSVSNLKPSAMEDSDHDSDVIILDEDPLPATLRPSKTDSMNRPQAAVRVSGGELRQGVTDAVVDGKDVGHSTQQTSKSGVEKHRNTSPILSRLSSALSSPSTMTPLFINVTGKPEGTVETSTTSHLLAPAVTSAVGPLTMTSPVRPLTMTSAVRPLTTTSGVRLLTTTSAVRPLTTTSGVRLLTTTSAVGPLTTTSGVRLLTTTSAVRPLTTTSAVRSLTMTSAVRPLSATSTLSSAPSSFVSYKSQSSLLLSSTNVQADIDSDDLSFTDSEDDGVMDVSPPPPHTSTSVENPISVSVSMTTVSRDPGMECVRNPQQGQTKHLMSVLDKLSPEQKMVLTQQLLRKGALSIEEPARPLSQPLTSSQNALGQPSKPAVGEGGGGSYISPIPAAQQLIPNTSTLRIVNTGSGLGAGQLTFLPQQENIVVRQPGLTSPLVAQQSPQGSVQILHQRPGIVVRHSVLPVVPGSSLPSHVPFAPTPGAVATPLAPSLSTLPVSHSTSLGAGLLSAQAPPSVLCQQAPMLNTLNPQPLSAATSQRVGYMGSFLVDPTKSSSGGDQKARLQLLSLIQGAVGVNSSGAAPTSMPGVPTSVVGSGVSSNIMSQPAAISQPTRVIRVVVDKSIHPDHGVVPSSAQSLVRIVQVAPSAPSPSPTVVTPPIPAVPLQTVTSQPSAPLPTVLPFASTRPTVAMQTPQNLVPTSVPQDAVQSAMYVRKRPAYTTLPSLAPPTKRTMILPVEKNGLLQGSLAECIPSSLQKQPDPLVSTSASTTTTSTTTTTTTSSSKPSVSKSSSTGSHSRSKLGVHLSAEQANTALAGIRTLLKHRLPRAKKRNISATHKDSSSTSSHNKKSEGRDKDKVKPKTNRRPMKKKSNKGGPLSHPIVHLSHQAGAILPQAEVEEEIRDTPLRQNPSQPPSQQPSTVLAAWPKDMPRLAFEITSQDGFSCRGNTMEEVWKQVTDKVQDARAAARMKQLSYGGVNGVQMFGVGHEAVVYLVEQLVGAAHCRQYKFRFQDYEPPEDEELLINPSGSARCSAFTTRKPYDIFSFLMSRHRQRPREVNDKTKEEEMEHKSSRRATSMELPMAMRFRKLQEHAKEAVGVYRSKIHGRGLFCKRNIDNGEMVIEYSGEIIRSSLTDKREKYYESKGIGCYMFRIDDCEVVDATMHGSAARFINHSCEPNCYSKVISVDGKKHIVIFANRAIKKGEELTYDYKFPIEDVKIPCTCGSRRCRKYLN